MALTPEEFDATPLAASLRERHGWGIETWTRLDDFWSGLLAALRGINDVARRGRIMERHYADLFRAMGADEAEIAAATHAQRKMLIRGGEPDWIKDLQYAAVIMNTAPGLSGTTIDEATRGDRLGDG